QEAPMVSCRSPVAFVFATMAQTVGWAKARARGLSAHRVADTRRADHLRVLQGAADGGHGAALYPWWGCARGLHLCPPYQISSIQRSVRLRRQVRRCEQIVGERAPGRDP